MAPSSSDRAHHATSEHGDDFDLDSEADESGRPHLPDEYLLPRSDGTTPAAIGAGHVGEADGLRRDSEQSNSAIELERGCERQQARDDERRVNRIMLRSIIINTLLTLSWFALSMSLSIFNKWMFSDAVHRLPSGVIGGGRGGNGTSSATLYSDRDTSGGATDGDGPRKSLNFRFPLFSTSIHMLVQLAGSAIVLRAVPRLRKALAARVSVEDYTRKLAPCGVATALDIGCSNASLKTISLAFYTMCKSSNLAFVLLFAFLFRLERPTGHLVGVIGLISIGVILMVATETRFVLEGFLLIMTASCMGGLRWALTQTLLHDNPATRNPFASIYRLAPIMFVSLFVLACVAEGPLNFISAPLWRERGLLRAIPLLLFPGVLAFGMTASEFALIRRTSVVTLSVAGILKEVLTIAASVTIYGDVLTPLNISGLAITVLGIAVYNYIRFFRMRKDLRQEVSGHGADTGNVGDIDGSRGDGRSKSGRLLSDPAHGTLLMPEYDSDEAEGDDSDDGDETRSSDHHRMKHRRGKHGQTISDTQASRHEHAPGKSRAITPPDDEAAVGVR